MNEKREKLSYFLLTGRKLTKLPPLAREGCVPCLLISQTSFLSLSLSLFLLSVFPAFSLTLLFTVVSFSLVVFPFKKNRIVYLIVCVPHQKSVLRHLSWG